MALYPQNGMSVTFPPRDVRRFDSIEGDEYEAYSLS